MSIWKTVANVSTAVFTAFFLFGCAEKESTMVQAIPFEEPAQQHVINVNPDPKASQTAMSDWDKQMAANKAALDAIPAYDYSQEEDEIEFEEGIQPTDAQASNESFNDLLNKENEPRQMKVSKSDYKNKPSTQHTSRMPSESVILAVFKYEQADHQNVVWCKSDAAHTQMDLDTYNEFYNGMGDSHFSQLVESVVEAYGGYDAVLNSCK